jgi:hypothetical protein
MASKKHCIHAIMLKTVFFLPLNIVRPQNLCEAPFSAKDNLLATREFQFGSMESFLSMDSILVLAAQRQQHLPNGNSIANTLWRSESSPHSCLKPISPST